MKKDFEDELGCLAPIKTGEKIIKYTDTHTIYVSLIFILLTLLH